MRCVRMLFKNKVKVFVPVDDRMMPVTDGEGLVRYRYQNVGGAQEYTARRVDLAMIPGIEAVEMDTSVPESKPREAKSRKVTQTEAPGTPAMTVLPPHTIVCYTDGGASPNPGPAGAALILMYDRHMLEIWEYLGKSTNNIAELTAILRALENIRNRTIPVMIYSDSKYAIGVLTGSMKATKNLELIDQIREEMKKFPNLQLLKVRAHVGIAYNEHVDRLVALARDTRESGNRRSTFEPQNQGG